MADTSVTFEYKVQNSFVIPSLPTTLLEFSVFFLKLFFFNLLDIQENTLKRYQLVDVSAFCSNSSDVLLCLL